MKQRSYQDLAKISHLLHLIASTGSLVVTGYLYTCKEPPTLEAIIAATALEREDVEIVCSTLETVGILKTIDEYSGTGRIGKRVMFNPAMDDTALAVISSVWFEWYDNAKLLIPAATAPEPIAEPDIEKQETAVFPAIGNFPIHHCTGGPEMVTFPPGTNVYPPLESLDTSPHVVVHTKSQLL